MVHTIAVGIPWVLDHFLQLVASLYFCNENLLFLFHFNMGIEPIPYNETLLSIVKSAIKK